MHRDSSVYHVHVMVLGVSAAAEGCKEFCSAYPGEHAVVMQRDCSCLLPAFKCVSKILR